jgi:hypothetical protein
MLDRYNFHCWYYFVDGYLHTLAIAPNENLHFQLFIVFLCNFLITRYRFG